MMSIGEFAASVGASVRTVTRYVNEGKLTPTARTAGGQGARIGVQQRELADRMLSLEQRGFAGDRHEPAGDESWGAQIVKSAAFGDFVGGRTQKARVEVKNTLTGADANVAPDRKPGIVAGAAAMLTIESLLNSTTTTSNAVEFTKENFESIFQERVGKQMIFLWLLMELWCFAQI